MSKGERAGESRLFRVWTREVMTKESGRGPKEIKTNIYIDGYNLYYGCLKHTPYKWLNIEQLFFDEIIPTITTPKISAPEKWADKDLIPVRNGNGCVKFFTAEISAKIAKSDESLASQRTYHRALELHQHIQVVKGSYSITKDTPLKPHSDGSKRPTEDFERVEALKVEEKMTDVNIALYAYHDAVTDDALEQIVFVSNDTDLAPAIEFIKNHTDKLVGLITPTKDRETRRTNKDLSKRCDWVRERIDEGELARSQLQRSIQARRSPAVKPWSWYPNHDILERIIYTLDEIHGKRKGSVQWLTSNNPFFDERKPIDIIEDRDEAKTILRAVSDELERRKEFAEEKP